MNTIAHDYSLPFSLLLKLAVDVNTIGFNVRIGFKPYGACLLWFATTAAFPASRVRNKSHDVTPEAIKVEPG
jgi:hypothetical protein